MARINDYTIELGFDSRKANQGIRQLEKRLNNLARVAQRVNNIANQGGGGRRNPSPSVDPAVAAARLRNQLEHRRITMLDAIAVRERRLIAMRQNVSLRTGRGKQMARELDESIIRVREFQREVRRARLRSGDDLLSLRRRMSGFTHETGLAINRVNQLGKRMGAFERVGRRALASFTGFAAASMGAYALANLAGTAYDTAKAFESLNVQMIAGFGSQSEATKQMEYVRGFAKDNAVDVIAAGEGWAKLGINASKSGIAMSDAKTIFEATLMSSRAFNLSTDDTKGAIRAIGQIMSKEKVNAEDFRLQLAERMPAAMANLREATGMSKDAFAEAFQAGKIPFDALAKWAKVQRKMVVDSGALAKALTTMAAGQTLFFNALKESARVLFEGKLDYAMGNLMRIFSGFFSQNEKNIGFLGDLVADLVDGIAWAFNVIAPLFSMIITGYRLLYEEWMKIAEMDWDDAIGQGGMVWFLKLVYGLMLDVRNGWLLITNEILNFKPPKFFDNIALIFDSWGNSAKNRREAVLGGGTFDPETMTSDIGWRAKLRIQGEKMYDGVRGNNTQPTQGDTKTTTNYVNIDASGQDPAKVETAVRKVVDEKFENGFAIGAP